MFVTDALIQLRNLLKGEIVEVSPGVTLEIKGKFIRLTMTPTGDGLTRIQVEPPIHVVAKRWIFQKSGRLTGATLTKEGFVNIELDGLPDQAIQL